jgi:hypothetical protein
MLANKLLDLIGIPINVFIAWNIFVDVLSAGEMYEPVEMQRSKRYIRSQLIVHIHDPKYSVH